MSQSLLNAHSAQFWVGTTLKSGSVFGRRQQYQAKVAGYLTQLLAGNPGVEDKQNYEEGLERHRGLAARLAELDRTQQLTLEARNTADRLDAEADDARNFFGKRLAAVDESAVRRATSDLAALDQALARIFHQGAT